jgi:multiple sugar transport system permease protein
MNNMNIKSNFKKILINLSLIIVFIYFTFPLFWIFWTSIKPSKFAYDPGKWIFKPTFEGYLNTMTEYRIPELALNSFIVSGISVLIALSVGTLAAYAMVRYQMKHKKKITFFFLAIRFIPPLTLVLPLFLIGKQLGILDTRIILIISYQILCITFSVLMMKGFLQNIPSEYEEAAMIEGCTRLKAFFLVTLPLVKNGLFATGIFLFLYAWKDFVYAFFLTSFRARTLPTAVEYFLTIKGVNWNAAMAYGFLTILPTLIIAIILRNYMIQGLTFGLSK